MESNPFKPKTPEEIKEIEAARKTYESEVGEEVLDKKDKGKKITNEEVIEVDADIETRFKGNWKNELIKDSNLRIEKGDRDNFRLFGSIGGKKIDIRGRDFTDATYKWAGRGNQDFGGERHLLIRDGIVDGKKINEKEAKDIYLEYLDIAQHRSDQINRIEMDKN